MSLIQSKLQPYIAENVNFDRNEDRPSLYGTTKAFLESTQSPLSIFKGDLADYVKRSSGNTVKMPVIKRRTVAVGDDFTCSPTPVENESDMYTFSKQAFSFNVSMFSAQYGDNYISYERDFTRKIAQGLNAMMADIEAAAIATLELYLNEYWTNIAPDFYAQSGNAIQVPQAQKNDFYNQLNAMFMRMNFPNPVNIITSPTHMPTVNFMAAQGAANNTNLQFQLNPYQWYWSNLIQNGLGVQSTLYAIEEGSLGVAFTDNRDAMMGNAVGTHKEWGIQSLPIPGLGQTLPFSVLYTADCVNGNVPTGRTDLSATKSEIWQFLIQPTFAVAYNSDPTTDHNPVVKAEITSA